MKLLNDKKNNKELLTTLITKIDDKIIIKWDTSFHRAIL